MLKLADQDVKILHLEPTDACNAACPQCARETDTAFDKTDLHHLTLEKIKELVDVATIKNLDKLYMCGDYGDPAAGKHTIEIYRYFRKINPTITLGMNTNGGLRSTKWWRELANIFNQPKDYVVFSIDGLADTNHIYRINVDYEKVINSARAFIDAGGSAHWDMLVFAHNEHQVDLAQAVAKKLGFSWFRAKVSKRFQSMPIEFLNPPKTWQSPLTTGGMIECPILLEKSLYISARGEIYPCCWLGANTDWTVDKFNLIQNSWLTDPNPICQSNCSKNKNGSSFSNQWQREVELNGI
jgi:MoaA/NifB/PqqE/SkfB family radical SAM enzyme